MGAPIGNQNAKKAKISTEALKLELAHDRDALRDIWRATIKKAKEGDLQAVKEINDRLEGKPAQAIIGGGDDDPAIKTVSEILIRAVDP